MSHDIYMTIKQLNLDRIEKKQHPPEWRTLSLKKFSTVSVKNIRIRRVSRTPGGGSEGSGPIPAPAHGRFYT